MNFGEPSLLHQPRSSMRLRVKRLQDRQLNRSTSGAVSASRSGCAGRDSRWVKESDPMIKRNDQTLRVPARVVMLGPPYPLISPMSRVRI